MIGAIRSGHQMCAGKPSLLFVNSNRGLISPAASPYAVHDHMDKNLHARTAKDQDPTPRDADRGRPQYAAQAKASTEGQNRGQGRSHLNELPVKRPVLSIDEPEPKKAPRADRPPTEGFVMVVDGHFKSEFDTLDAAERSGRKLKSAYPMLQIEIYDAATKARTMLS